MKRKRPREPAPVHRPLALGAIGYLVLIVVAGASLAHLGQRELDDAALRSATMVVEAELRERVLDHARLRARRADDVLANTEAAAHAIAAHLHRLGPGAVDTSRPPFEFEPAGGQALPGFASNAHDLSGLAPDPAADEERLGALSWRGLAMIVALRTARLQVPERTRFSVWVRGEGLLTHPRRDPTEVVAEWAVHAGFGAGVLAPPQEPDGWLAARTARDRTELLPYVVSLPDDDGQTWAIVRAELVLDDLLPRLVDSGVHDALCHSLVLDQSGRVLAAAPGTSSAFGLGTQNGEALGALTARLAPLVGEGRAFAVGEDGTVRTGAREHLALARVGVPGWTVAAIAPRDTVAAAAVPATETTSRAVRDFALAVFGFSALFGVLAAFVGIGFADSLRRRLLELAEVARAHAAGRLDVRAVLTAGDEISEVGRAMNATAARMQDSLRRLEEGRRRLSGLIDSMAEGLVITDVDDRVSFVNGRFAAILKRPGDSLVGRDLEEFLVPDSLETYRGELRRRRDGGRSRYEVTWRCVTGDHPRTIVSAMPLFDPYGRYAGSCCIVTDITTRARAQEETARAEKLRALGEMAGGVAHDFNNVLTAVLGNTQYLLQEPLDPVILDTLRVIETAAMDGTETVNRIRKFTRPSVGIHHAGPVDANVAAYDVLRMARPRFERVAHERGVRFEVVLERNAVRCIRGNTSEIREVLLNLVNNALDAMPDGGTLTLETFDRGEDAVGLRVSDTGHGIPATHIDKIFDPFFSTKRGGRCSGLGLSICFGIVRAHSGRIDVRSEPRAGTTFTVVLPAFVEEEEPASDTPATPPEPRILLVSTERTSAQALQKSLNESGLHAALVESPVVGLDLASDPAIFNTLVVQHAPGGRGWDLARAARRARADLRIVLLTDAGNQPDDTQARNAGIDRVLVQPFDAEDVRGVILTALANPPAHAGPDREPTGEASGSARRSSQQEPVLRETWGGTPEDTAGAPREPETVESRGTIDA